MLRSTAPSLGRVDTYRKAVRLPRLGGRSDVGHLEVNLEGYFYLYTPTFSLDINPDNWEVEFVVERDDEPLPNPETRPVRSHPEGFAQAELFRDVPRNSSEAHDHSAYVDDDEEGPLRWSSGEYVHCLLFTYHYEDTQLPYADRRRMNLHADYEKRLIPTIDGPLAVHIETWMKNL